MKVTINVTRDESVDIWRVCNELDEAGVVRHMRMYYGCELFTSYAVVVHRRAPAIPMMSWNLPRFDRGRTSCTVEDCHTEAIS